jgi:hypothetical protein
MTTTLIYEPIASISDDYFRPPKASHSVSSRDNTDVQRVAETGRLVLNVTDGNEVGWTSSLPEANSK